MILSTWFDIPIYLPSGKSGIVRIPQLTKEEWNQLIAILEVYKPSIIKEMTQERENDEKSEEIQH